MLVCDYCGKTQHESNQTFKGKECAAICDHCVFEIATLILEGYNTKQKNIRKLQDELLKEIDGLVEK